MFAKRLFASVATTVTVLSAVISIAGFLPHLWLCDLVGQFRIVWVAILLGCLLVLVRFQSRWAGLALVALLANAFPLWNLYARRSASTQSSKTTIKLVNFNTECGLNKNTGAFEKYLSKRDPDVFAVTEINRLWITRIADSTKKYLYKIECFDEAGMALYSKFPIVEREIRYFGEKHHPRILATVVKDDVKIHIILAHPTTEKNEQRWLERDEELKLFARELSANTGRKILIGDLNCGPWSYAMSELAKCDLHDSEQGFGPQPSWPARLESKSIYLALPPVVPIDHIFVGDGIQVLNRTTGPPLGSDHLPVFVTAQL